MANKKMLSLFLLTALVLTISSLPFVVLLAEAPQGAGDPGERVTTTRLGEMASRVETAVIDIAVSIVIIGWVIAGILYLTAAGKPEKLEIAKKALIACVIGTLLVVLAMGSSTIIDIIKDAFDL